MGSGLVGRSLAGFVLLEKLGGFLLLTHEVRLGGVV